MRDAIVFTIVVLAAGALVVRPGRLLIARAIGAFVLALVIVGFLSHSWIEVPPGQVGAVYDPFRGGIQNVDLREGWHLIPPWANLQLWSVRTQEYTMSSRHDEGAVIGDDSMQCQTVEGLQLKIDATVLFNIDPGVAHVLWKTVGPNYVNTIVRPATREAVRSVVSQYPIMSVYSNAPASAMRTDGVQSYPGRRQEVENRIFDALTRRFEDKGIHLERVLLRNVDYVDPNYEAAIVNKQVAQQQVLTQQFLLQIEQIKAQQKVAQAEGQSEAIRLRGEALRTNPAVTSYEFVRQLPSDMDVKVLPGNGGVILNLPSGGGTTPKG